MKETISDEYGLAVFRDASVRAPEGAGLKDAFQKTPLKSLAKDGSIFFIDGEDPIRMMVEVLVDEPPNDEYIKLFEPVGGRFLLQLPTGDLSISGYEAWVSGEAAAESLTVTPGAYSMSVYSRQVVNMDEYEAAMARLVGADDWRFSNRINYVAAAGCLPLAIAALVAVFASWTLALYPAAVAAAFGLAFLGLTRTRRHRNVEKARKAFEGALPVYILHLARVEQTEGLAGGYVL